MHKSRLPVTLKRKSLSRSSGHGSHAQGVSSAPPKHEDDPPVKMYSLDSERLRAIEALGEDPLPQQAPVPGFRTSLRRLILSDDEDEDVRILMERTQELLRSSKKKKKKKDSGPAKELVQSSCESDQGIGSMPSSIISVSGHVNPLPEEKEEDEEAREEEERSSLGDPRSLKKGLATLRSELLMEKPIRPNIHVGSKLKAMLEENKGSSGGRSKPRTTKKTGRWDAIMKNINENQKASEKRTYKEVKSKVFDDLAGGSSSPRAKAPKSGPKSLGGSSGRSSSRASLASTGRPEQPKESPRDKAKETVRRYANGNSLENQKKSSSPSSSSGSHSTPKLSARKSKDRRISNGNSNTGRHGSPSNSRQVPSNQPDLVKSSTVPLETNLTTGLEKEIHAKSRQVEELCRRLDIAIKSFDVMTLLYQRTLSKVNSNVRNKDQEQQIKVLQDKLNNKDLEIDDLKKEEAKLRVELESGLAKYKNEKTGVTEDYNRRLSQIKTQHASLLEKVERNYRDDLEELKANHSRVLLETQEAAEAKLQHALEENEGRWKAKILEELSMKEESLRKLEDDSQLKEKEWESQKAEFARRINELLTQGPPVPSSVSQQPPSVAVPVSPKSKNSDNSVIFNLNAEVESLKAVVDMRTADVHQLRKDNVALEEKLAEFEKIKLEHAKTLALLEDLRAQIESKSLLERKLSEENRYLQNSVERELVEKKRLSMENEELMWKIQHDQSSLCGDTSSLPHNQSMSFMEGVSPRNVLFDYDEDEAAKLSFSFTEGISESPFKSKTGLSRSMSLKERKMGVVMNGNRRVAQRTSSIDIMSTSLPPPRRGKSAFVREVIDKGDSVSWKIEYGDKAAVNLLPLASPIPKRRLSPGQHALSCPPTVSLSRRKLGVVSGGQSSSAALAASLLYNEPLSESSESTSSTSSMDEGGRRRRRRQDPPGSIDIVKDSLVVLNADELSSSSEIEIDEKRSPEEESTLRPPESMATSLPSYDLQLLFSNQGSSSSCKESGGESLMTLEEEETTTARDDDETKTERTMTDSLSAVSWSDDFEE